MILILVIAFFMLGCKFSCNGTKEYFSKKECNACMKDTKKSCKICITNDLYECNTSDCVSLGHIVRKKSTGNNWRRLIDDRIKERSNIYRNYSQKTVSPNKNIGIEKISCLSNICKNYWQGNRSSNYGNSAFNQYSNYNQNSNSAFNNRAFQDRDYQPAGGAGCPMNMPNNCYHPACCAMEHCKNVSYKPSCTR